MREPKVRPELKGAPSAMCFDWALSQDEVMVIVQLMTHPKLWRAIVAKETEACAMVAEMYTAPAVRDNDIAEIIAAAIRARGTDESLSQTD